jgi:hypothetical protein
VRERAASAERGGVPTDDLVLVTFTISSRQVQHREILDRATENDTVAWIKSAVSAASLE